MSDRTTDLSPVEVQFQPDPGFQLVFDGLHAEMELGRPFLIQLELSSGKLQAEVWRLVGGSACVWMYLEADETTKDRYFHGIVTRVVSSGLSGGAYRYKLELRPWIWLLSQVTDCAIFQDKSAFQIVTQIFRDAGFSDFEDQRRSASGDAVLEYCVQYRETSLDFVTRLMEQFGFYYYFTFTRTAHKLILADDPNAHTLLPDAVPFKFDMTDQTMVADHIWKWSTDLGLLSGKTMLQDYNFKTPWNDLTTRTVQPAEHPLHNALEIYDYPGPYDTTEVGQRLSDVRMQAVTARRRVFDATSNSRKLVCGWRFKLSDYPDSAANRAYLIVRSVITLGGAEGTPHPDAESVDTYRVELTSIADTVPFRLMPRTPRPVIRGPQTARVVGDGSANITTDAYGRVKVKFHWDRSSRRDEERTCWIRVAQTWAGAQWGAMFIPRHGMEVVVEFLEGNPDRPLITGVVYNESNKPPYGLPENKTRSTIKSGQDDSYNELRFEDKGGEEEIYVHAQKDYNREVKNDVKDKIFNNRTVEIQQGNDSLAVNGGNHSIKVAAGTSAIEAAQSITLTVGSNSIKIDQSGVTINGMQLQFSANATVQVSANATMSLQAGGPLSLQGAMISLN